MKYLAITLASVCALVERATAQPIINTNCDPGVDIPRDDVNITDIAFKAFNVNQTETSFETELQYYPEQVIPYEMRSSVFFYLIGNNGLEWPNLTGADRDDCAFEFDFSTGHSIHSSEFDFPKKCFTTTTVGASTVYSTDLEYFYCIGTTETCDRVDAAILGFDKQDRESLRDQAYCTKLTYKLTITYTPGAPLDQVLKFVLEYIRDPVEPIEQFFNFEGTPAILQDDVWWAICDQDDLGTFDYAECINRLAVNPEPRVLSLSTETIANDFGLMFALGPNDRDLVSNDHPLTIVVENSEMWLFHALYSQSDFSDCEGLFCTKVSTQANFDVGFFGADAEVTENYIVRLQGDMPLFVDGDLPTDMQCDNSFCTMVWVLNFRSVQDGRRLRLAKPMRFHTRPIHMGPELESRELQQNEPSQKSATQGRAAKVSVGDGQSSGTRPPAVEQGPPGVLIPILAAVGGVIAVFGVVIVRRRQRNAKEEDEEEKVEDVEKLPQEWSSSTSSVVALE